MNVDLEKFVGNLKELAFEDKSICLILIAASRAEVKTR